jgi:hypothetical protein
MTLGAAILLCALVGEAGRPAHVSAQASRGAHRHLRLSDVREQIIDDVEIAEVTLGEGVTRENLARSRGGRYEAFTAYHDGQLPGYRIYFAERGAGKVYEVRGLPLPHRPFSDLVWINSSTLAFDRWSQPHYGIHYVVSVSGRKLLRASAFPDEVFLEQQRTKPRRKKKR